MNLKTTLRSGAAAGEGSCLGGPAGGALPSGEALCSYPHDASVCESRACMDIATLVMPSAARCCSRLAPTLGRSGAGVLLRARSVAGGGGCAIASASQCSSADVGASRHFAVAGDALPEPDGKPLPLEQVPAQTAGSGLLARSSGRAEMLGCMPRDRELLAAPQGGYGLVAVLLVIGIGVFGVGAILGYSLDGQQPDKPGLELAKALLTLGTGFMLGGALKVVLDRYQDSARRRQEEHDRYERLLADLRLVHDRAERARLMVAAHRSASTYGKQMRDPIGCQVVLLKIKRILEVSPIDPPASTTMSGSLVHMLGYLRALQEEYRDCYKEVSDCQRTTRRSRRDAFEMRRTQQSPLCARSNQLPNRRQCRASMHGRCSAMPPSFRSWTT